MKCEFAVRGEPRPKGSKTAFVVNWPHGANKASVAQRIKAIASQLLSNPWSWKPQTVVSEVSKYEKEWENVVRTRAAKEMEAGMTKIPAGVPVRLTMEFYLQRPQAHYGTGKNAGVIKDRFVNERPLKAPDLSKLFRSAEDALNSVVFDDDCQVVEIVATKMYGTKNGVIVRAEAIEQLKDNQS